MNQVIDAGRFVLKLPIDRVIIPPIIVRPVDVRESAYEMLRASIAQFGVMCPILVTHNGCELVKGLRRLTAAREVGLSTVPTLAVLGDDPSRVDDLRFSLSLSQKGLTFSEIEHYLVRLAHASPKATIADFVARLGIEAELIHTCFLYGHLHNLIKKRGRRGELSLWRVITLRTIKVCDQKEVMVTHENSADDVFAAAISAKRKMYALEHNRD